jgi:glutamyl-tRNA reductase
MSANLAPHEILNIQELLNSNILEAKMLTNNISIVQDENLKQIMKENLESKKTKLKELEDFINNQMNSQNNCQNNNQNNNNANNSNN